MNRTSAFALYDNEGGGMTFVVNEPTETAALVYETVARETAVVRSQKSCREYGCGAWEIWGEATD